jgi:hypothetical protein
MFLICLQNLYPEFFVKPLLIFFEVNIINNYFFSRVWNLKTTTHSPIKPPTIKSTQLAHLNKLSFTQFPKIAQLPFKIFRWSLTPKTSSPRVLLPTIYSLLLPHSKWTHNNSFNQSNNNNNKITMMIKIMFHQRKNLVVQKRKKSKKYKKVFFTLILEEQFDDPDFDLQAYLKVRDQLWINYMN